MKNLFLIILILVSMLLVVETNQLNASEWLISPTVGNGHMIDLSVQYWAFQYFSFGLGGNFTYAKDEYTEYLYGITGNIQVHLYEGENVWFNIRERIGYEKYIIDDYDYPGKLLSTDLLMGYKGLYGVLGIPIFLGKYGNVVSVQMGLGYRFRI